MMPGSRPSTLVAGLPLRGRYLVRNPLWNAWLRVSDLALGLLHRPGDAHGYPTPKRVLLAIGGHIGDAVIATSVLPELAKRIPNVEIGLLCSSWNRAVFDGHPRARWIHAVDHWHLSRSGAALLSRWTTTYRMRARALDELRGVGYDAAIDLASHYPNSARLLYDARIPQRVGYTSGGGGPLYTQPLDWSENMHVSTEHMTLLNCVAPAAMRGRPTYDLPPIPAAAAASVAQRLAAAGLAHKSFAVVHAGSGHSRKEWPLERWVAVVRDLSGRGVRVVLTGRGPGQAGNARALVNAVPGVVSFVDELQWEEFRAVLAEARLLMSVDTVAMHVAAAHGTPCVALMTGMDRPDRWRPIGNAVSVLSEPVPCAPCFRSRGCAAMSCIRDVKVKSVLDTARVYLPH